MIYKSKFKNGDLLKDNVTGFKGRVMVVLFYATGCIHYGLIPIKLKDGLPQDWVYLDESRVILNEESSKSEIDPHGGPAPKPPQW